MRFGRRDLPAVAALWLILLVVCLPRFNRADVGGLGRLTEGGAAGTFAMGDASVYVAFVEHLRGTGDGSIVKAPFIFRPLVPLIAAQLPWSPLTSINIVNVLSLAAGVLMLYLTALRLGLSRRLGAAAGALFAVSFPAFYYGAIGYVDPVLVSLLMAGVYFLVSDMAAPFLLVLAAATLTKESALLLVLASAGACVPADGRGRRVALFAAAAALFVAISLLMRASEPHAGRYLWVPSLEYLLFNVSRPRAWISLLLSFGLPGLLALNACRKSLPSTPAVHLLKAGFAASLLLAAGSLFSSYADGRAIWASYPFAIPLGLMGIAAARVAPAARSL